MMGALWAPVLVVGRIGSELGHGACLLGQVVPMATQCKLVAAGSSLKKKKKNQIGHTSGIYTLHTPCLLPQIILQLVLGMYVDVEISICTCIPS